MTSFAAWLVSDTTGAAGTALAPNTRAKQEPGFLNEFLSFS
jgi:hypothetical protein